MFFRKKILPSPNCSESLKYYPSFSTLFKERFLLSWGEGLPNVYGPKLPPTQKQHWEQVSVQEGREAAREVPPV